MEIDFKMGSKVNLKANKKKVYTVLKIYTDGIHAECSDSNGHTQIIPILALENYIEPKGPSIRSISPW